MSDGWPLVAVGDILTKSGETIALVPSETYREVTVRMWGKGVVLRRYATGGEIAADRRAVVREGQFILSRIDSRNGAFGIVPPELDGAVVSNDFPSFDPSPGRLETSYLSWLSKTPSFVDLCRSASEGTTNRVRLKEDLFFRMTIPLPPINEQRRIVARIAAIAAKVEEAQRLRRDAGAEAELLNVATATESFSAFKTAPRMPIRVLGLESTNPIQTGPFGAQLHASEFVEEGVPVLNVGNVWPTGLRLAKLDRVSPGKAAQLSRYSLQPDDLLFARSGATLGKVCLVPNECDGWLMTGHLFRVRLDKSRCLPEFAFVCLSAVRDIRDQVFGQVRGATRPGFNTTLLGNVEIPLPSIGDQVCAVANLATVRRRTDVLKRQQSEVAAEIEAILPAVLDRAFKGEL